MKTTVFALVAMILITAVSLAQDHRHFSLHSKSDFAFVDDFSAAEQIGRLAERGAWKFQNQMASCIADPELYAKYKNHGPILKWHREFKNADIEFELKAGKCQRVVFTLNGEGHIFRVTMADETYGATTGPSKVPTRLIAWASTSSKENKGDSIRPQGLPDLPAINERWVKVKLAVRGDQGNLTIGDFQTQIQHAALAREKTSVTLTFAHGKLAVRNFRISPRDQADATLPQSSQEILVVPKLSSGPPAAGRRVTITPAEYEGTNVFHTLFLPANWKPGGPPLPIIFEFTGNYHPNSGSTGRPEDAALGFGLSGGRHIWVSLPFIRDDHTGNAVTWWGDEAATMAYAKMNVPRIIDDYGADPKAVVLCGFSRGAIGVNYIGLHDDEISKLWTAFVAHDHFDGVRQWNGTTWGQPLERYRIKARERLQRVGERPYLVSQNGNERDTETFIRSTLSDASNFRFVYIKTDEIFGTFPNQLAKSGHTDRWLLKPSTYRETTWNWMNRAAHATDVKSN